jgi:hypothetical protein
MRVGNAVADDQPIEFSEHPMANLAEVLLDGRSGVPDTRNGSATNGDSDAEAPIGEGSIVPSELQGCRRQRLIVLVEHA